MNCKFSLLVIVTILTLLLVIPANIFAKVASPAIPANANPSEEKQTSEDMTAAKAETMQPSEPATKEAETKEILEENPEPISEATEPVTSKEIPGEETAAEGSGLLTLKEKLVVLGSNLAKVVEAADKLSDSKATKEIMQESYKLYSGVVAELNGYIEAMNQAYIDLERKADPYFADWEDKISQIKNKSLSSQGKKSFTKAKKDYDRIKTDMNQCLQSVNAYFSDMQDVVNFLEYDLNQKSISNAKGLLKKLKSPQSKIEKLISDITKNLSSLAEERNF